MKKKLIGAHNLDTFIQGDKLCLTKEHILSPGARDAARNRGISIVYGNTLGTENSEKNREELSRRIVTLLRTDFNLTDPEVIKNVTLEVLRRIENEK